jgi:hypothetical protein
LRVLIIDLAALVKYDGGYEEHAECFYLRASIMCPSRASLRPDSALRIRSPVEFFLRNTNLSEKLACAE